MTLYTQHTKTYQQSPDSRVNVHFLSIRMPVEVLKLTQFTLLIVIDDRNLFQPLELCIKSLPKDVTFLLGELHVHQFEVYLGQEESVWKQRVQNLVVLLRDHDTEWELRYPFDVVRANVRFQTCLYWETYDSPSQNGFLMLNIDISTWLAWKRVTLYYYRAFFDMSRITRSPLSAYFLQYFRTFSLLTIVRSCETYPSYTLSFLDVTSSTMAVGEGCGSVIVKFNDLIMPSLKCIFSYIWLNSAKILPFFSG